MLTMTLLLTYYCYPHFTCEQTEAQSWEANGPVVTQAFELRQTGSKVHAPSHYEECISETFHLCIYRSV